MRMVKTSIACPVCAIDCEVTYAKPALLGQSLVSKECPTCGTDLRIIFKIKRGGQSQVEYKIEYRKPVRPQPIKPALFAKDQASLALLKDRPRE